MATVFGLRTPNNLPESQEKQTSRELERMVIYGDTRLPSEFSESISGFPEFSLGVIAKFRTGSGFVIRCRYVKFMDGIPSDAVTRPVGQLVDGNPYEASYLPSESNPGMILGIAMVSGPVPIPCYGWVQIDGIRDLPDAVAFNFGDTVYWHSNGSITDNAVDGNGVVGIAMGAQRVFVSPWWGQPAEALPPYLISDIIGLQTILDNLVAEIAALAAGDLGNMVVSLNAQVGPAPVTGVDNDFAGAVRTTHGMQVVLTGGPSACVVSFEAFIGDWTEIGSWSLALGHTSGMLLNVYDTPALKTRAVLTTLTGGAAPTVTATLISK